MFEKLLNAIKSQKEIHQEEVNNSKKLQIATCALFLEIANSDEEFLDIEKESLFSSMAKLFSLSSEDIDELVLLSQEQIKKSVSLYEFTQVINNSFTTAEKYELVKLLWSLVYVDGKLDAYEDYFMKKIGGNLNLSHNTIISAKLEAKRN